MKQLSIKPSQQGQLDNLCSIYSVVNAIAYLYQDKPRFKRRALKFALLRSYSQWRPLDDLLIYGMDTWEMDMVLGLVIEQGYFHKRYPIKINKPFLKDRALGIKALLERIRVYLDRADPLKARIVLIGTSLHWTLIHTIDEEFVYLFDSAGTQQARRTSFKLKVKGGAYLLEKDAIYFMQRAQGGAI